MFKADALIITVTLAIAFTVLSAFLTGEPDYWVILTRLGDEEIYLVIGVFVYYFVDDYATSLSILTSVLLSGSLNVFLKYLFNTPRPPNPLVKTTGPGFPSGHTQVSSSFWLALSMSTRRVSLILLSLVVITGVSLSRIYLRAHYLVDVIGGLVFGFTSTVLSYYSAKEFAAGRKLYLTLLLTFTILVGACNLLVLKVEHGAASALLGLTFSLLLALTAFNKYLYSLRSIKTPYRVVCFTVSLLSLVAIHYATEFINPFLRTTLFSITGLFVFVVLPLYASRLKMCKCP